MSNASVYITTQSALLHILPHAHSSAISCNARHYGLLIMARSEATICVVVLLIGNSSLHAYHVMPKLTELMFSEVK